MMKKLILTMGMICSLATATEIPTLTLEEIALKPSTQDIIAMGRNRHPDLKELTYRFACELPPMYFFVPGHLVRQKVDATDSNQRKLQVSFKVEQSINPKGEDLLTPKKSYVVLSLISTQFAPSLHFNTEAYIYVATGQQQNDSLPFTLEKGSTFNCEGILYSLDSILPYPNSDKVALIFRTEHSVDFVEIQLMDENYRILENQQCYEPLVPVNQKAGKRKIYCELKNPPKRLIARIVSWAGLQKIAVPLRFDLNMSGIMPK